MKKILVLGASSFIGAHFCKTAKKKYDIIPLIRNKKKSKNYFLKLNPDLKKKIVIYKGINDLKVIKKILNNQINFVINFSAYGVLFKSGNNILNFYNINFLSVIKLVELFKFCKIERYVHIGTVSELQLSKKNPSYFINNYSKNHYALSKLFASIYIENIVDKIKIPVNIVTLFPVFGPYENKYKLIPYVIKNLKMKKEVYLTSGKQKRYYAYVDDVVERLIVIISKKNNKNKNFFILGDNFLSIKKFILKICKILKLNTKLLKWNSISRPDENINYPKIIKNYKNINIIKIKKNINDSIHKLGKFYIDKK